MIVFIVLSVYVGLEWLVSKHMSAVSAWVLLGIKVLVVAPVLIKGLGVGSGLSWYQCCIVALVFEIYSSEAVKKELTK